MRPDDKYPTIEEVLEHLWLDGAQCHVTTVKTTIKEMVPPGIYGRPAEIRATITLDTGERTTDIEMLLTPRAQEDLDPNDVVASAQNLRHLLNLPDGS